MDISNPTYLFYSERIIRKMMEHYAQHPGIIGYQVDNETILSEETNNYNYQVGFVNHLKKKFGTPQRLNKIWGFNYWGMTINDWEELAPRDGITNTGYRLEWERYNRKTVSDFLNWQTAIVREYKREDQFVMQCYMPMFQDVDQVESSRLMDVIAINVYHGQQDDLTGNEIALAGDFFRSVKQIEVTWSPKPMLRRSVGIHAFSNLPIQVKCVKTSTHISVQEQIWWSIGTGIHFTTVRKSIGKVCFPMICSPIEHTGRFPKQPMNSNALGNTSSISRKAIGLPSFTATIPTTL